MALYITGYGSKLVPKLPFCVSFRPPRLAIEHGTKAVWFGPAGDGLGFAPIGDATVEDVTSDIAEYPRVPIYALHTPHFGVPVTDRVTVYSADAPGRSFEVQLEDAAHRDEMLWIQGPILAALDLQAATGALEVVGEGTVEKHDGAARWRECLYSFEAGIWHQRVYALTLLSTSKLGVEHHLALLAQCPAPRRLAMFELSDRWAAWLGSEN
jgi:hypothetical protein